ncbi:MAG: cytochrome c biogenesis protein CcdA [Thermodesulfovibrionales bacterium]|nr:cytochrome c biogenesis protein CcdA [Thermodesulfovibrionales bacterium]
MTEVTFTLAFLAGFMSFLSPCILPLVPVYISFITGLSIEEMRQSKLNFRIFLSTLAFIAGFSTIFITLGASSSLIGALLIDYQNYLRIGGGIIVIFLGLFLMGIIKVNLLMKEKRFHIHRGLTGYLGSFLIGVSFAAGWTPCIGPILGTILIYVNSQASTSLGLQLLGIYSVGLALPFLFTAFAINLFFTYTRKLATLIKVTTVLCGVILVIFGILLLLDKLAYLSLYTPNLGVKF